MLHPTENPDLGSAETQVQWLVEELGKMHSLTKEDALLAVLCLVDGVYRSLHEHWVEGEPRSSSGSPKGILSVGEEK